MARPTSQGGIDYPDGGFASGSGVFPMAGDLAELAARLGSVVTFNREGSIVHIETFEHGIAPWNPTGYGTGSAVVQSSDTWRSSGYSCKMTAGSDGIAAAKIFRKFPYPQLGRYGLEFSWTHGQTPLYLQWRLFYHDGTNDHEFSCRYRTANKDLQVKDSDNVFYTFATGVDLMPGYAGFQSFKLVVDFVNDVYDRLIVNQAEYDLSAYKPYVFAASDAPSVRVDIDLWGHAGANDYSYVDDIILTQNEPTH